MLNLGDAPMMMLTTKGMKMMATTTTTVTMTRDDDKENDKDDGEEFINDGTKHNDCTKPTGLPPASWDS